MAHDACWIGARKRGVDQLDVLLHWTEFFVAGVVGPTSDPLQGARIDLPTNVVWRHADGSKVRMHQRSHDVFLHGLIAQGQPRTRKGAAPRLWITLSCGQVLGRAERQSKTRTPTRVDNADDVSLVFFTRVGVATLAWRFECQGRRAMASAMSRSSSSISTGTLLPNDRSQRRILGSSSAHSLGE